MTTVAVALLAVLVVAVLGQSAFEVRKHLQPDPAPEPTWWEQAERRQVMVHMADERTMRGLVSVVASDGVLLASPEYLQDDGTTVSVAGEAFIPAERVLWVQVIAGPKRPRHARKR